MKNKSVNYCNEVTSIESPKLVSGYLSTSAKAAIMKWKLFLSLISFIFYIHIGGQRELGAKEKAWMDGRTMIKYFLLTFANQATTGQIHFVRERTVASQERELEVNQKLFKCVLWSEIYDLSTKLIHTLLSGGAQGSGWGLPRDKCWRSGDFDDFCDFDDFGDFVDHQEEHPADHDDDDQEDPAPVPVKVELIQSKKQPVQWVGRWFVFNI